MFGVIRPLCDRVFCCIFVWYFFIEIRLKYEKKIFCCPALELFHCLPLWKTVLFVSSRAFSLSTPTFLLSTPAENSEATWKKATKCNKVVLMGNPNCCFMLIAETFFFFSQSPRGTVYHSYISTHSHSHRPSFNVFKLTFDIF